MISVIDSGNTFTKIGFFENGKLNKIYQKESVEDTIQIIRQNNPLVVVAGTVNFPVEELRKFLPEISLFEITSFTPVPFSINYLTPETLGTDRLAVVAYAWQKNQNSNNLIIDAGTCITYDFIDRHGIYHGGGISPGVDMRLQALHEHTAGLPAVPFKDNPPLIGDSTENSILSGVLNGIVAEVDGLIRQYEDKFQDLTIFMSGGSSIFFESKIKHSIFAIPNMVLWGLFSIYEYNNQKYKV